MEAKILELVKKIAIPMFFVGIILIACVCLYWAGMRYKTSENAFIEGGHPISIASRVAGQVKSIYVENNKIINQNSAIIELDSSAYQAGVNEITSGIKDITSKLLDAVKSLEDLKSEYDSVAGIYNSKKAMLQSLEDEYTKSAEMYKEGVISKQDYDKMLNDLTDLQNEFREIEDRYNPINVKYSNAISDVKSLEAQLKKMEQDLVQANYNLANTKVVAPEDGFVSGLELKQGDSLKAAQVFMILKPIKVWIVADYKARYFETVENGQIVWIKLDLYPNKKFKGHIESIKPYQDEKFGDMVTVKVLFDESLDNYDIKPGKLVVLKLRERG